MSKEGNTKVAGKGKFEIEEGTDRHLVAKPVQITQAVVTYQRSEVH